MTQTDLFTDDREVTEQLAIDVLGTKVFPVDRYGMFNLKAIGKILTTKLNSSATIKPSTFFRVENTKTFVSILSQPYTTEDIAKYVCRSSSANKTTFAHRKLALAYIDWATTRIESHPIIESQSSDFEMETEPVVLSKEVLDALSGMIEKVVNQKFAAFEAAHASGIVEAILEDEPEMEEEEVVEVAPALPATIIRTFEDGIPRATARGYIKLKGFDGDLKVSHVQKVYTKAKSFCELNNIGGKQRAYVDGKKESFLPLKALDVGFEFVIAEKKHPFVK